MLYCMSGPLIQAFLPSRQHVSRRRCDFVCTAAAMPAAPDTDLQDGWGLDVGLPTVQ